ncbi:MAG TPA: amidohydrolase [Steroidobacteraceae bacterium]|nr:amidohydrolase [Steroidobacteraceae bacterium]
MTAFRAALGSLMLVPFAAAAAAPPINVEAVYPEAHALYMDLHRHPELSGHEERTAANLAARLRALGFQVTEHIGGAGIVAILANGAGPKVMLRTELDALPVEEKTGLPYASREPNVMHACGHDLHMAALVATAAIMAGSKSAWHGTLMLVGQPAEETVSGAQKMIDDGLFKRFARPDVGIALHVTNDYAAGQVAITPGVESTNSDNLSITVFGRGGHGAYPQTTVDPIVLASRIVLDFQTIVSREVRPGATAIITVGALHAGTVGNVIPDQAVMRLTVRTYEPDVRRHVLEAIARIAQADAQAAGAPRAPLIELQDAADAVYNDPGLSQRLRAALERSLGKEHVVSGTPVMSSEDYSRFVIAGVPSLYMQLGGADPQELARAKAAGTSLPSNHSPLFAPDVDPSLHTAISTEVAALRYLFANTKS